MCYADAGNSVHKPLEKFYNKEITNIEELKIFFNTLWEEKYKLQDSKIKFKKDEYWEMILQGIELNVQVTSTELKIFYQDVVGYLDVVDTNADEIKDWKTSTRRAENEEEYTRQLFFYSWLYHRKFNRLPTRVTVYYLKYKGEKGVLSVIPTMSDIEKVEEDYNNILKQMGEFKEDKKIPPMCERCHMFCQYKNYCFVNKNAIRFTLHMGLSKIQLEGPVTPLLIKGIENKFSYELKDAYFIKKAQPHANTMIRFWSNYKYTLPIGFKDGLIKTLKDYADHMKKELSLNIKDNRVYDNINVKMPDGFVNGIKLRDYQIEAADKFLRAKTGIFQIGTGGGKTECAIEIIRRLGYTTLFIVDKVELLKQTKKRIEDSLGIEVGQVGGGKIDWQQITVATIQTLNKNVKDYEPYLRTCRVVIFDECLHKHSQIILPNGEQVTIEEIYNNDSINKVLSYNEETQIFEVKNILRKIKQPMNDSWWNLLIEDELGNKHKLVLTPNHKIWTTKGYKRVDELNTNDILKVNLMPKKYKCDICGNIYENKNKKGFCMRIHKDPTAHIRGGKSASKVLKERRKNKEYDLQIRQKLKDSIAKLQLTDKYWEIKKQMGLKRKGKNNPVFNKGVIEKIRKSRQQAFFNMTDDEQKKQIHRFNTSYRIMPKITKPEQTIIDMNIQNLKYNKNSEVMFKFTNNKWKIPDFKVIDENKVIEVSDFEHWRTKEYAKNIIYKYKQIGIKCLYLDKDSLYNDYDKTKKQIEKFCYNHTAKIVKVQKTKKHKNSYKYNLEIEDNHNYIANRILVSNCHKVAAKSFVKIGTQIINTEYRLGLSATPYRSDGNDMCITSVVGYKIFKLNSQDLIKQGLLVRPTIQFIKNYMPVGKIKEIESKIKTGLINETVEYANAYPGFVSENEYRNNTIVDLVKQHEGRKILILTKLVDHGKELELLIPGSEHLYGGTNKTVRDKLIKDFSEGNLNILISTVSIWSEGIDCKPLSVIINASGNRGDVKTIQMLGRILRTLEGKEKAIYIDFMDDYRFFRVASIARKRALIREGHNVEVIENQQV